MMLGSVPLVEFVPALTAHDIAIIRDLFGEYSDSLDFDLTFQDFNRELAELPGEYAPPSGRLYIAYYDRGVAGCIALRPIDKRVCEMKRMYVRPTYRKKGIGIALARLIINDARMIGYQKIRLDTVPSMREALSLYSRLGFKKTAAYRYNPMLGAIYMELKLI